MKRIKVLIFIYVCIISHSLSFANEAPNFWLSSITNEKFNSTDINDPFVISFFFVDCIPCIKEIPMLYKFMEKEFPNIPLLFIDPIKEDSLKDIKKFSRRLKVPQKMFYKDSFGSVANKFKMNDKGFPSIFGISNKRIIFILGGLKKESLNYIKLKLSEAN